MPLYRTTCALQDTFQLPPTYSLTTRVQPGPFSGYSVRGIPAEPLHHLRVQDITCNSAWPVSQVIHCHFLNVSPFPIFLGLVGGQGDADEPVLQHEDTGCMIAVQWCIPLPQPYVCMRCMHNVLISGQACTTHMHVILCRPCPDNPYPGGNATIPYPCPGRFEFPVQVRGPGRLYRRLTGALWCI